MKENLFSVIFSKNTRFKEKFMRTNVVALEILCQKGSTCFLHEREVLHVKKIIFRVMALFREGREAVQCCLGVQHVQMFDPETAHQHRKTSRLSRNATVFMYYLSS